MFYKVLGMVVFKGAKVVLRRKYGPTLLPKPLVAGGLVVGMVGLLVVLGRRESGSA